MLLYRLLWILILPFVTVLLLVRLLKGKEDSARWKERLGLNKIARKQGQVVHMHGASVGESLSILPIAEKLLKQHTGLQIVLTTGTRSSAKLVKARAPEGLVHQFVPLDFYPCVRAFYKHWQPDISVFVESEFWPELLTGANKPVLLNGRISDKSFVKYQKWSWFFKPLLGRFKHALAQREEDAKRLQTLGVKAVKVGGNLKFDAPALQVNLKHLKALQKFVAGKRVLVVASTHAGEEEQVLSLHNTLKNELNLLTIIVPRHPNRGTEIGQKLKLPCQSLGAKINPDTQIYIANTLGELGLWYRLADVVIIGGSLVPHGGHNPLEPLKLNKVTLAGEYMFNFKDMLPILAKHKLLTPAKNLADLSKQVQAYMVDKSKKHKKEQHIKTVMPKLYGATEKSAELILAELKNANSA